MEAAFNDAIKIALKSTIKGYINEFSKVLAKKLKNEDEWTSSKIIEIWNGIAKDLVVKKGGKKSDKEVDPDAPQCCHKFGKGEKNGEQCQEKVSDKSSTGKYCVKHYKQDEKEKKHKEDKTCLGKCSYTLTKGDNAGDECGLNVTSKSKSGKYCSKHISQEKNEKKFNKVDYIKFLKDQLKGEDIDVDKVLSEVVKKFGFMSVYNMESFAPKIFEEIADEVGEFIESNVDDHSEEVKEFLDQRDEEEKKKKKEKSKKKVSSDDEESDGEEESKESSNKKKDKSGSNKSKKNDEEEEEKPSKSGSNKSKKNDEEEEEKPSKSGSNKSKKKNDEEEEKKQSIKAKKFKTGELTGEVYFEHNNVQYLLNSKNKSVGFKVVNDKKKELSNEDKKIIKEIGLNVE
jgi:hypothetical protein